ncbi:MAG TPA: DUF4235 domain-containing protein [Acidothermaceae bacterium]|jgi:hypothetical protein
MSKTKELRTADDLGVGGDVAPAGGRPETIARKLYSAVAATIAARIAGVVVNRIWVKATGKKPPTDTKSPDVKWTEAVAWTALSATSVTIARLLASRRAQGTWEKVSGEPPK